MSWLARMDISRKASLNSARAWIWVRNLPMRTTGVRAAMARAGRVEDTVIHVEKAVRLMLQSADYCDKLGRLFAAKDSIAEALLRFEQAATLTGLQACDSEDARCQVLQHQAAIRRPSGRHSHTKNATYTWARSFERALPGTNHKSLKERLNRLRGDCIFRKGLSPFRPRLQSEIPPNDSLPTSCAGIHRHDP